MHQIANGQIIINTGSNPTQLVNNYLVGNGVTVSNITFTGNSNQIGYFDGTNSNIGLPFGVVMSSGDVTEISPTGNPSTDYGGAGDNDILLTAQSVTSNPAAGSINSTFDAAVLEFDFIPVGDSVRFNFVFASEEYTTWINTQYNDAFGFYLSGPNPVGGNYTAQNMAIVPGTSEPITISTIHPGMNSQYYVANPVGHSFNGFTTPITIEFAVTCGETYHFKFAVADCMDGILDTGVFLEGGSFSSDAVEVAVATVTGDTAVYEGCTSADFIFSRPEWQTSDILTITYDISGTAVMGNDFNNFPSPIVFLPGEDTVIVTLTPTVDGIAESNETVIITAYTLNACGDTITSVGTVWIFDNPIMSIGLNDTTVLCKNDSILVSAIPAGGFGPYAIAWSNGETGSPVYVSGILNGDIDYLVTITDQCGFTFTDTLTVTVTQNLAIDTVTSGPSTCDPTGWVSGVASGFSGVPYYHWSGPGANNPSGIDASVWQNLSSGWYYFTVEDNICVEHDSVFVDILNPPVAQFTATPTSGCGPLSVTMTNSSQNASDYKWDFGNGQTANLNTTASQTQVYSTDAMIQLIAFQGNCSDTTYATITVLACGCTDPLGTNYNPLATIEDGSCVYPLPTVYVPNVFSPNNDGANDQFYLTATNYLSIDIVILNRWGNTVYEKIGINPAWNGKTQNGAEAEDGVYFYRYKILGLGGQTLEGQGFIHLIR